jgi:MarR-like DNA-binding transcriptional regulator SgrR of sgrS sRNA
VEPLIRFEIDEMPLGFREPHALDYIGRLVGSAMRTPCLRFDDENNLIIPSVLSEMSEENGGLLVHFRLTDGKYWSDGELLSGNDLVYSFNVARRNPYWAHYLRYVSQIDVRGDIITFALKRRMRHLPALLCADELSPSRGNLWQSGMTSLGPYVLECFDLQQSSISLKGNPFSISLFKRPRLDFVHRSDVDGVIDRFMKNETDVTCSTMFPLKDFSYYENSSDFHCHPSSVWMQLEISSKAQSDLLNREVRKQLSTAIDREALANSIGGGISPRMHSIFATNPTTATSNSIMHPDPQMQLPGSISRLTLAYYDYYPNRQVAEFLQYAWENAFGIEVMLIIVPFNTTESCRTDLRLELRFPIFPDCIAEMESQLAVLSHLSSHEDTKQISSLVQMLDNTHSTSCCDILSELRERLDDLQLTIPLLNIQHNWMMNPRVLGFSFPNLGNADFSKLRMMVE